MFKMVSIPSPSSLLLVHYNWAKNAARISEHKIKHFNSEIITSQIIILHTPMCMIGLCIRHGPTSLYRPIINFLPARRLPLRQFVNLVFLSFHYIFYSTVLFITWLYSNIRKHCWAWWHKTKNTSTIIKNISFDDSIFCWRNLFQEYIVSCINWK